MRTAGTVAALLLAVSFSGCAVFSHGIENCTQGDTDSYLFGLFFCVPLALGSVVAFSLSRGAGRSLSVLTVFTVWAVGLAAALDLVPWAISSVAAGHHPCGAMYDSYLPYMRPIDPYVPLIYVVLLNLVLLSSLLALPARRAA